MSPDTSAGSLERASALVAGVTDLEEFDEAARPSRFLPGLRG